MADLTTSRSREQQSLHSWALVALLLDTELAARGRAAMEINLARQECASVSLTEGLPVDLGRLLG